MKSKRFFYKFAVAALSTAAIIGLTACGDDSSSSPNMTPSAGYSSASESEFLPGENPITSSSAENKCDAMTPECTGMTPEQLCAAGIMEYCAPSCDALTPECGSLPLDTVLPNDTVASCIDPIPAELTLSDFNDIGDVYKSIKCNEKVVFVVRHGDREAFTGSTSSLTEDGFDAAVNAGQKMPGDVPFKYIYSGMVRTYQTALGFAAGRGEVTYTTGYAEGADSLEHFNVVSPEFVADSMPELRDGWFVKDKELRDAYIKADPITFKNSNMMYSLWVYEGEYADVFYDLDTRSKEIVSMLVKDYAEMPKYTLAASHDQVLMPLTAWATGKQIDLKLHESRNWLTNLAGIAIIINDKNELHYWPIKGLATGVE